MNGVSKGGCSFFTVLGIVFVVLKLTNVINWSWWIVLLPFWGQIVLCLIIAIVIILAGVIAFGGD